MHFFSNCTKHHKYVDYLIAACALYVCCDIPDSIIIFSSDLDGDDEDISSLEEIALRNLKELEEKQEHRSNQLSNLFNEIKEDEILRHEKEERMREENKRKASKEHKMKMDENEV